MPASYFVEDFSPASEAEDEWPLPVSVEVIKLDRINDLRQRPLSDINDLDAAIDLTKLTHKELEKYGTDGSNLANNDQSEQIIKSLKSVLRRVGITFSLEFRDFETFRSYWHGSGLSGSWQARRNILNQIFMPIYNQLDDLEENRLRQPIPNPVTQHSAIVWAEVDEEVRELRRKYEAASTAQDYRALGTNCVGVFEALGRVVFSPIDHLVEGEESLPDDRIKERLDRFIEGKLPGHENAELRAVTLKAIALAHRLKHRTAPSAEMAGIACDSCILVTSMVRRLSDATTTPLSQDEDPF